MNLKSVFSYGFAIFAMFFGSGNLVFPIEIGANSLGSWVLGFLGLLLTGVLLPLSGLFAIKIYRGNIYKFFGEAGGLARTVLPFFTLSLLGSFGVVPRCITVAHGGISYVFPQFSLWIFSLIFCVLIFLLCLKENSMIKIIGEWMSPILLFCLFLLIVAGSYYAEGAQINEHRMEVFKDGFFIGYQTMDLFAAFFFSALIFKEIQASLPKNTPDHSIIKAALLPSLIGSILLALVYAGFVYLGAHYAHLIRGVEPEKMLPTIAFSVLGDSATIIIAVAMVFSCLTTAIALNSIYARYLCTAFSLKEKYYLVMLSLTTGISFVISLLDFKGIALFLAPVLEISYPGLIFLTIMGIIGPAKFSKIKKLVFWLLTLIMAAKYFVI